MKHVSLTRVCPACGFTTISPKITDHTHYDHKGKPYTVKFTVLVKDKYAKPFRKQIPARP